MATPFNIQYVMRGTLPTAPFTVVTWSVWNTPDLTGASSGYGAGFLQNIYVDYTINNNQSTQTIPGPTGPQGPIGPTGPQGPAGAGVVFSGDLSGNATSQRVIGLQNHPVSGSSDPALNQVLTWNGSAWAPENAQGGSPTLSGDVTGPAGSNTVVALRNNILSNTNPNASQALVWNGGSWAPKTLSLTGDIGAVTVGTNTNAEVIGLQGNSVSPVVPTTGQSLVWSGSAWVPTSSYSITPANLTSLSPADGALIVVESPPGLWQFQKNNPQKASAQVVRSGSDAFVLIQSFATTGLPFGSNTSLPLQPFYIPSDITNCKFYLRSDFGVTTNTGNVTSWTDIVNASSASVTDGGNAAQRPAYLGSVAALNNKPCVRSNGTTNFLSSNNAVFQLTAQPFTIVLVVGQISWTVFDMLFDDYSATATCSLMQASNLGGTTPKQGSANVFPNQLSFYTGAIVAPNSSATAETAAGQGPFHTVIVEFNGVSSSISVDGGAPTVGTFNGTLANGITLFASGGAITTYCSNIDLVEISGFSRLLTSDEKQGLLNHAAIDYGITRKTGSLYLVQGDSITQAEVATDDMLLSSYPAIVNQRYLGGRWYLQNMGLGGTTAQSYAASPYAGAFIDSSWDQILYTVALGVNDITAGRTDVQLEADLATVAHFAKSAAATAGVPIKIGMSTITPSGSWNGTQQTYWNNVNTYIRNSANWATLGIDFVIDVAANSAFSTLGATSNLTYYTAGLLHPNTAGTALMASIHAAAIKANGAA